MKQPFLFDLFRASIVAGGAALALMLVSPLWNRTFTARWKSWLWCVLAGLLLAGPFLHLPAEAMPLTISVPKEIYTEHKTGEYESAPPSPGSPEIDGGDIAEAGNGGVAFVQPALRAEENPYPSPVPVPGTADLLSLAEALWGIGLAAFALWQLGGELLFRRRVRRWVRPMEDAELNALYQKILPEIPHPVLMRCSAVNTPMLTRLFRPWLLLPQQDYTEEEASLIFRHELLHLRSRDLWRKLLFLAANAVHWFNPAVWLLRREAERDLERACDERVISGADLAARKAYGSVLLKVARAGRGPAISTGLSGDAKALRARLENILAPQKRQGRGWALLVGLLACGTLLLSGCVTSGEPVPEPPVGDDPEVGGLYHILVLGSATPEVYDTILLVTYDPTAPSLDVLSIPRNTYLDDAALPVQTLCMGGYGSDTPLETMKERVSGLTGTPVDSFFAVDTAGLAGLVDAVGGVDCDVPLDMDYDDPYQELSIHLRKGRHHLTGEQFVSLLRYRRGNDFHNSYPKGDLDRISVQQQALRDLAAQLISEPLTLSELADLAKSAYAHADTDLTLQELTWLGKSFLNSGLTAEDLTFSILPGEYGAVWNEAFQSHLSVWIPDSQGEDYEAQAVQLLSEAFSVAPEALGPADRSDSSTGVCLSFTVQDGGQLETYQADFAENSPFPLTLYHFCHPLAEDSVDLTADGGYEFDHEMLSQARSLVKRLYSVDCSQAEAHAYGYQNKIAVQLHLSPNEIFDVRFWYQDAAPVGVLFFDSPEAAQLAMEQNDARCLF